MTVLSLHPAKMMTTGEGGAVLTDSEDLAAALRRFRNHGIETELAARHDWTYAMVDLGYNYRLTDIAAALGSASSSASRSGWPGGAGSRRATWSGWPAIRLSNCPRSIRARIPPGTSCSSDCGSIA